MAGDVDGLEMDMVDEDDGGEDEEGTMVKEKRRRSCARFWPTNWITCFVLTNNSWQFY